MTHSPSVPMPAKPDRPPRSFPALGFEEADRLLSDRCGAAVTERFGEGSHKVLFLPEAVREFRVLVGYGRRSPMNRNEQKYVGLGHFFRDRDGRFLVAVSHFVAIHTTHRSPTSVSTISADGKSEPGLVLTEYELEEYARGEAKYNIDADGFPADPFLKDYGPSEFVLDGHTHPDIGVFFSGPDRVNGAARTGELPVCIFVCDPIRRELLATIGKRFEPAEVLFYERTAVKKEVPSEPAPVSEPAVSEPAAPEAVVPGEPGPAGSPADDSVGELLRLASACRLQGARVRIHSRSGCLSGCSVSIRVAFPKA